MYYLWKFKLSEFVNIDEIGSSFAAFIIGVWYFLTLVYLHTVLAGGILLIIYSFFVNIGAIPTVWTEWWQPWLLGGWCFLYYFFNRRALFEMYFYPIVAALIVLICGGGKEMAMYVFLFGFFGGAPLLFAVACYIGAIIACVLGIAMAISYSGDSDREPHGSAGALATGYFLGKL